MVIPANLNAICHDLGKGDGKLLLRGSRGVAKSSHAKANFDVYEIENTSKLTPTMKHMFTLLSALLLAPLAELHAAEAPRKWNILFL